MTRTEERVEMVGGPSCGRTMPVLASAVALLKAGKAYTVRVPATEVARAVALLSDDEIWSRPLPFHRYDLRFRQDRADPSQLRAVLWYCGLEGA